MTVPKWMNFLKIPRGLFRKFILFDTITCPLHRLRPCVPHWGVSTGEQPSSPLHVGDHWGADNNQQYGIDRHNFYPLTHMSLWDFICKELVALLSIGSSYFRFSMAFLACFMGFRRETVQKAHRTSSLTIKRLFSLRVATALPGLTSTRWSWRSLFFNDYDEVFNIWQWIWWSRWL